MGTIINETLGHARRRFPAWIRYSPDKRTTAVIEHLTRRGLIEAGKGQYRAIPQ